MPDYTRDELMALTPGRYLAAGYLDETGQPRAALSADYAIAAATQLGAADMPAQELAFTYEALRLLLDGQDVDQARDALDEALATVVRMIRQTNNEGLVTWLGDCVAELRQPADIGALLGHIQAVLRLYAVIASLPEPSSDPSFGEPVQP